MECLNTVLILWLAVVVPQVYTEPKVEIRGPTNFTTDGTRDLTLNAEATGLGAGLYYAWGGLCSSNTDTCTFRPRLDQDGEQVLCTAANPVTGASVAAQYSLNLNYPPVEPPKIENSTTRRVLTSGDVLTCTVSGGKPLVSSVNFTCTNPFLPDQTDVTDTNAVSSSVTVEATRATDGPMVCSCSALWRPEPGLYLKEQTLAYVFEMPPSSEKVTSSTSEMISSTTDTMFSPVDTKDNTALIAAITCALIVCLIVGIVIIVIVYLRKKGSRAQDDNVESSIGEKKSKLNNGVSSLPSKNEDGKQVSAFPTMQSIVVPTEDDQPGLQDQQICSSGFSGSGESMASTSSTGSDNSTSCLI